MKTKYSHNYARLKTHDDLQDRKAECRTCNMPFPITQQSGRQISTHILKVHCPNCGSKFGAKERHIGRTAKCPKCGVPFVVTAFPNTVNFKCTKCHAQLEVPKQMLGHPEVCSHCKKATLVTQLESQFERHRRKRDRLKKVHTGLETSNRISFTCILIGVGLLRATRERQNSPFSKDKTIWIGLNIMGLMCGLIGCLGGGALIVATMMESRIKKIERTWVLELDPKEEQKRQVACKTVLL